MRSTVLWLLGLAMVAVAPSQSHAADLTTLVSFCAGGIPCADGAEPSAGLIADAKGNLFGATVIGGANDHGTVFEIINTASGYVSTPTTLVSFCLLANCADGNGPSGLIADAKGNLFGTTILGGAFSTTTFGGAGGTVSRSPTAALSFPANSMARREARVASARAFRHWPNNTAASWVRRMRWTIRACQHCRMRFWSFASLKRLTTRIKGTTRPIARHHPLRLSARAVAAIFPIAAGR